MDVHGNGQANHLVSHVNATSDHSSVQMFTPATQFPFVSHTFPHILMLIARLISLIFTNIITPWQNILSYKTDVKNVFLFL